MSLKAALEKDARPSRIQQSRAPAWGLYPFFLVSLMNASTLATHSSAFEAAM